MCYCPTPTLHLNLALTGDCAFLFSLKKTHSVWFISILNYGDTENVLINHLLLVTPMLYPCHYTNLCPHKPHKHAPPPPTHTHTHIISLSRYIPRPRGLVQGNTPKPVASYPSPCYPPFQTQNQPRGKCRADTVSTEQAMPEQQRSTGNVCRGKDKH